MFSKFFYVVIAVVVCDECVKICMKKASVKMHMRSLSQALKMNVVTCTEAGEHCRMSGKC